MMKYYVVFLCALFAFVVGSETLSDAKGLFYIRNEDGSISVTDSPKAGYKSYKSTRNATAIISNGSGSLAPSKRRSRKIYTKTNADGSKSFTDNPKSSEYAELKFTRPVNYIRSALAAFRRDKRSYKEVQDIVVKLCAKHNVEKNLVMAVIDVESGFNAGAVSPVGAQGLMQIMPATGKELALNNPFSPTENIDAGIRYLRYLSDMFPDKRLVVAAYNAGPNAVKKYGGIPPYPETQSYVEKVFARLHQYE